MKIIAGKITIKEFSNIEEMMAAYQLVSKRYEKMSKENFCNQISEMIAMNNFKMIGVFLDENLVGIAGYWVLRMLYCGKYLQVSSFIVDEEKRGLGIGKKILQELEKIAKKLDCQKIVLDAYTENKKSHSLYFRENFYIRGFHFMKDL